MQNIDFNEISIFVKVVQTGSFTQASKKLGIPISTVSARVASLERRLGITLLQRTTRQLKLTQYGKEYFDQCLRGLEEIQKAEEGISLNQSEPQGNLKITAPNYLGNSLLPPIIKECLHKYPKIKIEVILKDRSLDLISEGIDLAIRAGTLKDSSLIAKKAGDVQFALYASPSYLKNKKIPVHPKELKDHTCIQFTPIGKDEWSFSNGKSRLNIRLNENIIMDDLSAVKALAMEGSGIALLPTFICDKEEKKEKLIPIMHEWKSIVRPIYFVFPPQKFPSQKLKAFMEIAIAHIEKHLKN